MRWKGLLACLSFALCVAAQAKNPDVVLISLDTFRADRLKPWGGPADLAPNLNALAATGTVFTSCFTPAPITLPAHATLLTGLYPSRTGLHDNGFGRLDPGVMTLAQIFQAKGYRTQAVLASAVLASRHGLDKGFSRYDDGVGPTGVRAAAQVTDRALAALRSGGDAPLFLWVHYYDTHEPYSSPEAFANRSGGNAYNAAVTYVDSEVGRLLKALKPGTLVAVVSDHGEALGDHGELTHGSLLFQPTVHVVCVLAGPGAETGRVVQTPCDLADLAPTLARWALGKDAFLATEGKDLLAPPAKVHEGERTFPLETWLPYDQFRWSPLVGVTDGRFKWIRGASDRLYDLVADPGELHDLAADPPAAAMALKADLQTIPEKAPAASQLDPALLGLGYSPAPGGSLAGKKLPDPNNQTAVLKLIAQGRLKRFVGDGAGAAELFRDAVEKDPGNPSALFELGETLRRNGDASGAAKALDKAVAISPTLPEAWIARGHIYVAAEKPADAVRCYEKALALAPDAVSALNPLAAYYLDQNQPDMAFPLIHRAIASGIADTTTYLMQGRIHLVQNRQQDAEKDFTTALLLSSNPQQTLKDEADIYMIRKLYEQGLRLYDEGIERYPAFAPNYLTLATYHLQADEPEQALALFKRALACDMDAATRAHVQELISDLEAALKSGSSAQ
jgi:choline-sulfatase